jgi:hypothetical protein
MINTMIMGGMIMGINMPLQRRRRVNLLPLH